MAEKGSLHKVCRAYRGRKQMNAIKDSQNVDKNSGAVQKCCKPSSLLFFRELFQVIQCSQREVANSALDLANPRVSQLLSAWSNQKERRLDGGMAPPRVSVTTYPEVKVWMIHADATLGGNFSTLNTEPVWMSCEELVWGATGGPF